jgi:hypothetical protein
MDAGWEDAVKRGDIQDVRGRLDRGTDVDARDRYGQTALMLAAHAVIARSSKHSSLIGPTRAPPPSTS